MSEKYVLNLNADAYLPSGKPKLYCLRTMYEFYKITKNDATKIPKYVQNNPSSKYTLSFLSKVDFPSSKYY